MKRLFPLLIRLYPRRWRERYEAEFLALLEDRPPGWLDLLDILYSALETHLHHPEGETRMSFLRRRIPNSALRNTLLYGFLIGLLSLVYILISALTDINRDTWTAVGHIYLLSLFALCLVAGWRSTQETNRLSSGILAGVGAGVLSGILYTICLYAVTIVLLNLLRQYPWQYTNYINSGASTLREYLASAQGWGEIMSMLVGLFPFITVFCGSIGAGAGLIGAAASKWRRHNLKLQLPLSIGQG